jgi:hypothetical protein
MSDTPAGTDPAPSDVPPAALTTPSAVDVFDTTLRDGAQFEGISLTVDDKLRVAEQLDWLGVRWIEGGYPQANPRDAEFFRRAVDELTLETATLVAFGSTRRPLGKVDVDPTLTALLGAGVSTTCIVGKSSAFHVTEALRTTLDEGVAMVGDSVRFLRSEGQRVFFDAEHFFDGYKADPEFTLRCSCCATPTVARCPTRCSASSPRCAATSAPTSSSASTPRTTAAARWPTRWPRWSPAPPRCRARSTATASAPATPTS